MPGVWLARSLACNMRTYARKSHRFAATVRDRRIRLMHRPRPPHPPPTFSDDGQRPSWRAEDARRQTTDLPDVTRKNFSARRLDGEIDSHGMRTRNDEIKTVCQAIEMAQDRHR